MGVNAVSSQALERARGFCAEGAWVDAHAALSAADRSTPLAPADLELLARTAYMLGRDDEYQRALERAHYGHLDADDTPSAALCTWWIGLCLLMLGESAPAQGWFARGERLIERGETDCVARGYLLLAHMLRCLAEGDFHRAHDLAGQAIQIGQRFEDSDLVALAVMDQGHALLELGRTAAGLRLIDESMVAVTSGELSPIVAGILYCNTIAVCRDVHELRRAREWTTALTIWCARQPDMVAHKGVCLVHRAEIMQVQGEWEQALEEAQRVSAGGVLNKRASAAALYVQGELHRLRGQFAAAEDAYHRATRRGSAAQPGLALLRLAQGNVDAALAAIRRVAHEGGPPLDRAAFLPAHVEIALAAGEVDEAARASDELAGVARTHGTESLRAKAAYAHGAVALARGDVTDGLTALRGSAQAWLALGAPYEEARARALVGVACGALGDLDGAVLELDAARAAFQELGALPDVGRVDALAGDGVRRDPYGLSARELEVLRLLVAGETNKAIAEVLVLSQRTVDRHVSNIYAKLGVSSRAAATACAYEQRLV